MCYLCNTVLWRYVLQDDQRRMDLLTTSADGQLICFLSQWVIRLDQAPCLCWPTSRALQNAWPNDKSCQLLLVSFVRDTVVALNDHVSFCLLFKKDGSVFSTPIYLSIWYYIKISNQNVPIQFVPMKLNTAAYSLAYSPFYDNLSDRHLPNSCVISNAFPI